MDSKLAQCPSWLASHLLEKGGVIPFSHFMDLALNDPFNGSYSSGQLKIGIEGDFVTSPSLSNDFAELLAIQLVEWFKALSINHPSIKKFSLVEIGPGEGDLIYNLLLAIEKISSETLNKIEVILVEINKGMKERQVKKLREFTNIKIRWMSIDELRNHPVDGIIIAHEVLDALPVERIVLKNRTLFQVGVILNEVNSNYYINYIHLPLTKLVSDLLDEYKKECNIPIPPYNSQDGWNSELHTSLNPWFNDVSSSLNFGALLIIDYALDAKNYYNNWRSSGTIATYKDHKLGSDILLKPGTSDITSHLCIETLIFEAEKNNLDFIGYTNQGLALLSLGLANRISSLREIDSPNVSEILNRRESLLKLVDPYGLGGFKWFLFQKNNINSNRSLRPNSLFLDEPKDANYS